MKRIVLALALAAVVTSLQAQTAPVLRAYVQGTFVTLRWTASAGAASYVVQRAATYPNWTSSNNVGPLTATGDYAVANQAYVYRVVPYNAQNQPLTASNCALVTTFPFAESPVTANQTLIRAAQVNELRSMVNTARGVAGLAPAVWTNSTVSGAIRAIDFMELRSAWEAALDPLGLSHPTWVDSTLTGVTSKKTHIDQLRSRIRNYPETVYALTYTIDPVFSPNGDGIKDSTFFSAAIEATTDTRWTLNIVNSSNAVVLSLSGTGNGPAYTWGGRNGANVLQPDGAYTFQLIENSDGRLIATTTAILDNTPPTVSFSAPAAGSTVSNVRQTSSVAVSGSATDANFLSWKLERTGNSQPVTQIATGPSPVSSASFATWDAGPSLPDGLYTLRLTATDQVGNSASVTRDVTAANFSALQNQFQLNAGAGGTIAYTSKVPFTLTETLTIKNDSNTVIRTLVNGQRTAGVYNDSWDGRNDGGQSLPDGTYRYYAQATEGASSLNWDDSTQYAGSTITVASYPECRLPAGGLVPCGDSSLPFDPYANVPLRINYCVGPGTVSAGCTGTTPFFVMAKVASGNETYPTCDNTCFVNEFQPAGPHELLWYGRTDYGLDIGSLPYLTVIRRNDNWPKNMALVFGTAPVLSNLTFAPLMFNPSAATTLANGLDITFNVGTYQSRTASLKAAFKNLSSLSVLRTITVPLAAAGQKTVHWDGRADNGSWVAPGPYEITVTATDSAGNTSSALKPIVIVRY
jgi:flagellar basal-body rod modification protein FlgD